MILTLNSICNSCDIFIQGAPPSKNLFQKGISFQCKLPPMLMMMSNKYDILEILCFEENANPKKCCGKSSKILMLLLQYY